MAGVPAGRGHCSEPGMTQQQVPPNPDHSCWDRATLRGHTGGTCPASQH